jgi:hypothetical protein
MRPVRDIEALMALLEDRARKPFSWRDHDCVRFAAAAVRAQTGVNPIRGLRWRSKKGATAAIARFGSLEAAVDAHLTRIAPAQAMRGDIAGVPDDEFGVRLMVVEGRLLIGPGDHGIRHLPRSAMVSAWSADDPRDGEAG